jgi:hypothetical protein
MGKIPIMLGWRDHADFTRMMIALANQRQLAMCGMSRRAAFRYVESIVADAEVVIRRLAGLARTQRGRPARDQGPPASHDCRRRRRASARERRGRAVH